LLAVARLQGEVGSRVVELRPLVHRADLAAEQAAHEQLRRRHVGDGPLLLRWHGEEGLGQVVRGDMVLAPGRLVEELQPLLACQLAVGSLVDSVEPVTGHLVLLGIEGAVRPVEVVGTELAVLVAIKTSEERFGAEKFLARDGTTSTDTVFLREPLPAEAVLAGMEPALARSHPRALRDGDQHLGALGRRLPLDRRLEPLRCSRRVLRPLVRGGLFLLRPRRQTRRLGLHAARDGGQAKQRKRCRPAFERESRRLHGPFLSSGTTAPPRMMGKVLRASRAVQRQNVPVPHLQAIELLYSNSTTRRGLPPILFVSQKKATANGIYDEHPANGRRGLGADRLARVLGVG